MNKKGTYFPQIAPDATNIAWKDDMVTSTKAKDNETKMREIKARVELLEKRIDDNSEMIKLYKDYISNSKSFNSFVNAATANPYRETSIVKLAIENYENIKSGKDVNEKIKNKEALEKENSVLIQELNELMKSFPSWLPGLD